LTQGRHTVKCADKGGAPLAQSPAEGKRKLR
jgi:hypothetical protein